MPGLDELKKLREGLGPLGAAFHEAGSFFAAPYLSLLFSRSCVKSKFFKLGTRFKKAEGL